MENDELKNLREKINILDDKILELLKDRADIVSEIGKHKNSLEKQKFPTINMIRQILKCNELKLQPYIVCKGYDKITKEKILETNLNFI